MRWPVAWAVLLWVASLLLGVWIGLQVVAIYTAEATLVADAPLTIITKWQAWHLLYGR